MSKLLSKTWIKSGTLAFSALAIASLLGLQIYGATPPKAGAGTFTTGPRLSHADKVSPSASLTPKVLGLNTGTSVTKPSGGTVTVASATAQPSVTLPQNDPPIDPPPPVVCHIYDACGAQPADEQQGIYGTITIGPITPVCRVDIPCDGPYQTTIIVSNSEGEVTRFNSDAAGRFNVSLPPGTYTLTSAGSGRFPGASPQTVTVYPGLYQQVDLSFDTGIR